MGKIEGKHLGLDKDTLLPTVMSISIDFNVKFYSSNCVQLDQSVLIQLLQ